MHDTTSTAERARRSVEDCSAAAQSRQRHRPHRRHTVRRPPPPTQCGGSPPPSRSSADDELELDVEDVPTHDSRRRILTASPLPRRLRGDSATSPWGTSTPGLGTGTPDVASVLRPTRRRRPPPPGGTSPTADGPSTYSLRAAVVPARSTTILSIVSRPPTDAASGNGQRDRGTTRTGDVGRPVTDDGSGHRDTGTTYTAPINFLFLKLRL